MVVLGKDMSYIKLMIVYSTLGFTSVRKKTEFPNKSSKIVDVLQGFFFNRSEANIANPIQSLSFLIQTTPTHHINRLFVEELDYFGGDQARLLLLQ